MNFVHIKILEKSKRSSYQSVINSVSYIKPFGNVDFVCRVLFSHVFSLLVVEQGPPSGMAKGVQIGPTI